LAGACQLTVTVASPTATVGARGVLGTVEGVTELLAADAVPAPDTLTAETVKVTAVPLVKPLNVQLSPEVVQVAPLDDSTL
jgi:hypothetical protein